jgi:hypothetical protein
MLNAVRATLAAALATALATLSLADWARFCVDQLAGARDEGKLLSAAS